MPRGRPKKQGERYGCGQLKPEAPQSPYRAGEYKIREVVDDGQVTAQAYRANDPMDAVGYNRRDVPSVDGDQWRALAAYRAAWQACTVSGRSCIDMTPSGGGGMEAMIDARAGRVARFDDLHRALPPHLTALVSLVCIQGMSPADVASSDGVTLKAVYQRLGDAGDCLIVADRGARIAA